MDDLKKLSVERLRELARKHLGKGHSRLRTKAQLLDALKEVVREIPGARRPFPTWTPRPGPDLPRQGACHRGPAARPARRAGGTPLARAPRPRRRPRAV